MKTTMLLLLLLSLCTLSLSYPQFSDDIVKVERDRSANYVEAITSGLNTDHDLTEEEIESTIVNDDLIVVVKRPQHGDDTEQQQEYGHTTVNEESYEESEALEHAPSEPSTSSPLVTINITDFVALIPENEVKTIVKKHYRNDPVVQRSFDFIKSRYSIWKYKLLSLPEVKALLNYLRGHGLDVMGILEAIENSIKAFADQSITENEMFATDEPSMESTSVQTTTEFERGLSGLVDSILLVLPHDEILMKFFNKLDKNPDFANLMNSLSTPEFAKILSNLQNSSVLRDLINILKYDGIDLPRILESVKSYALFGTI